MGLSLSTTSRRPPRIPGPLVKSRPILPVLLVLALAGGLAWALLRGRPAHVEREVYAMGTTLKATVEASDDAMARRALDTAVAEVRRMDDLLSTWDSTTPMARLNGMPPDTAVTVDPELFRILRSAEGWARVTGRAFEPAVGPLIDAWNLRGEGRRPSRRGLDSALAAVRAGFAYDSVTRRVTRRSPGAWIDTGGFGKGAALAAVRDALAGLGVEAAAVDFGGQVLAVGAPAGQDGWRIGVAHPAHRDRVVGRLVVRDVSVATSGDSERFVVVDGQRLGHLLDPRTGEPVPAWGSVTVVARDPLAADALSTALFVLGPDGGMAWARDRDDVGVLFLEDTPDGLVARSNDAMRPWLVDVPGDD